MSIEQTSEQFIQKIEALISRVEINQIVFISESVRQTFHSKKDLDSWLSDYSHKIVADTALFFNDVNSMSEPTQEEEDNDLENAIKEAEDYLDGVIKTACMAGENKYKINQLFKDAVKKIDEKYNNLNYIFWIRKNQPIINPSAFFVVLNNNTRIGYPISHFEFEITCRYLIEQNFQFRKNLLIRLKLLLMDIFSTYLLLPENKSVPLIQTACKTVDICELIIALTRSKIFGMSSEDGELLKAILLKMFGISDQAFYSSRLDISKRVANDRSSRNKFMEKLSDEFR